MSLNDSRRKTEWEKIPCCLETIMGSKIRKVFFDTRDLYLLMRTLIEEGYKINFEISDIYYKEYKGVRYIKSCIAYIHFNVTEVSLPNMYGSIRLMGTGDSKINLSSQIFEFGDDLLKEDGFIAEIRNEDINQISLEIDNINIKFSINKSEFYKILTRIPVTKAKLEKEERDRALLYEQISRDMDSCLTDSNDFSLKSILHYMDED